MAPGNQLMYSGVPGRRALPAGFGATGIQVVSSTASLAKTGAAAGSFVPGVGTAIGAGIGAAIGLALTLMSHQGQKPQRLAQAQKVLQQLRGISPDTAGRQINWDSTPAGTSDLMFEALYLAGNFLGYQGSVLTDHPSSMWQWTQWFMAGTKAVVQAAATNPVGATVTVPVMTGYKQILPFTFTNPGLVGALAFTQQVLMPMVKVIIDGKNTNPPAGVAASLSNSDAIHVFALLYDFYLAQIVPMAAPQAISSPVMSVPTVQPGIPQQVTQYTPSLPANAPVYSQPAQQVYSQPAQPVYSQPVNTVQTSSGQSVDVNALVASLQAQGASQQQAFNSALSQLQSAGVQPTAQVQAQVANAVTAPKTAGFGWIEIALLAAVGLPLVIGMVSGKKH